MEISRSTQLVLIQFAKYSPNFALYATFIQVSMYIRICTLATAGAATVAGDLQLLHPLQKKNNLNNMQGKPSETLSAGIPNSWSQLTFIS